MSEDSTLNNKIFQETKSYFEDEIFLLNDYKEANEKIWVFAGILNFFENQASFTNTQQNFLKNDKKTYGDYQTPAELTDIICKRLTQKGIHPYTVIEPTSGKGTFIKSCIKNFKKLRFAKGIEISQEYILHSKLSIIKYYLSHNNITNKPLINIINKDIFKLSVDDIISGIDYTNGVLVIGNPPWVTNSYLSSIQSNNIPTKTNFKSYKGLDAITGRSNFDISEYITLKMLDVLDLVSKTTGKTCYLAFIIKNSTIRNILKYLIKTEYNPTYMEAFNIDAKRWFGVSAEASVFYCEMNINKQAIYTCKNISYKKNNTNTIFGWYNSKFVFNIDLYKNSSKYDGKSSLIWRQGVKHDCSKVMEIYKDAGYYRNAYGDRVILEDDLIYPLLKSSDIKTGIVTKGRKHVIIPQTRVGEDTSEIKDLYPNLYKYLLTYKNVFENRKSSIYKGKPAFSIFGIGEYSFKKFKIAVSGFSKRADFVLVMPSDCGKPFMFDDTVYFLGFDTLSQAVRVWTALNSDLTKDLLKSLVFNDNKRPFTKTLLMRVDIDLILKNINDDIIQKNIDMVRSKIKII